MAAGAADVVVVGAGTAGCVLAARLSEDPPRRVLLIEAGPDYPDALPADIASPLRPTYSHEWGYRSEPGAVGRGFKLPRGKIVGGCSATNAAIALRGAPADYDAWAARGNQGWSWDEVLPEFVRLERDLDFDAPWHGRDGPVPIRRYPTEELTAAHRAFLEACAREGIAAAEDLNAPGALGAGRLPLNVEDGIRQSAALTHLAAARGRANLQVLPGALVDRVVIERGRATGLKLAGRPEPISVGEVILAAGSYGSPAILMRSGVGPADVLRALGIAVTADRPGVGEGLADHPLCGAVFSAPAPQDAPPAPLFQTALVARSAGAAASPDLQFMPRSVLAVEPAVSPTGATVMLFVSLLEPRSRGRLALRSADPAEAPAIDPGYFTHPDDLPRLAEGFRLLRRLAGARPFSDLAIAELLPGPSFGDSDAEIARAIFSRVETYHHPVGTCRMGPSSDPLAVVDGTGVVHGVEGLRVADASIMPVIPSANTNLATYMLAERIAGWMRAAT